MHTQSISTPKAPPKIVMKSVDHVHHHVHHVVHKSFPPPVVISPPVHPIPPPPPIPSPIPPPPPPPIELIHVPHPPAIVQLRNVVGFEDFSGVECDIFGCYYTTNTYVVPPTVVVGKATTEKVKKEKEKTPIKKRKQKETKDVSEQVEKAKLDCTDLSPEECITECKNECISPDLDYAQCVILQCGEDCDYSCLNKCISKMQGFDKCEQICCD